MIDQGLPKVSVLMPAYNYGRYVAEALESALAQDYPADRFEVIVVDDGSTDDTAEIVRDLADRNAGRIKLITQQNSGRIAAMARARDEADGSLLALLDADDVWLASKVRTQVEVLRRRPEVGLVFCDMHTIDSDGNVINTTQYEGEAFDVRRLYARILRSNLVYTSSLMVRAELFLEPPDVIDDWDWWLTLCAAERAEVDYIAEPLALYRWHGDNRMLGADGAKLVGLRRRQLQFQLWTFRHMDLSSLTPQELWSAWGGAEWFAETAMKATGSHFLSLVSVTDAEREQAALVRERARTASASGDLRSAARLRLQALAWDPFEPEAFAQFRDAVSGALAADAVPHPLEGARGFVVLVDAEELLSGDEMLVRYADAMAGAGSATLAVDATRLSPREAASRLRELMSRCELADRDDIDVVAAVGPLDAAQRHRMHASASAVYARTAGAAGAGPGIPVFTPDELAELRILADPGPQVTDPSRRAGT